MGDIHLKEEEGNLMTSQITPMTSQTTPMTSHTTPMTSQTTSPETSSLLEMRDVGDETTRSLCSSDKDEHNHDSRHPHCKSRDVERQKSTTSRTQKAYGYVVGKVVNVHDSYSSCQEKYSNVIGYLIKASLLIGYIVYLGFAFKHSFGDECSITLLCFTCIAIFGWAYYKIKRKYGRQLRSFFRKHVKAFYERDKKLMKRLLYASVLLVVAVYLVVDVIIERPVHLIPGLGFLFYTALMFFFSANPGKVRWRPVIWGLVLQLILAVIALRTRWGHAVINWLGLRILDFMSFANEGAKFVFGDSFQDHFFVFSVMPTIVFFSSAIAIMNHLGIMHFVVDHTAIVMEYTMGVSAMESLHAAFNLFVGWGEALLVVRPVLDQMTRSEIHTIMTNSFSTISGSNIPIYIMFGIPANHLMSASIISAPTAVAMAKLSYPDDRGDSDSEEDAHSLELPERDRYEGGVIDAATTGAINVITIVGHVIACVIAYVGLLAMINALLAWFGARVGLQMVTFQIICSYIFWPFVYLMGIPPEDCKVVARMLGVKLWVNELIAYHDLGVVMKNREVLDSYNGTWHWTKSDDILLEGTNVTLVGGVISARSEVITIYALCGFSDMVSYGIMVAALTALAAGRKKDILAVGYRALSSGIIACFLSACMAGIVGDF